MDFNAVKWAEGMSSYLSYVAMESTNKTLSEDLKKEYTSLLCMANVRGSVQY